LTWRYIPADLNIKEQLRKITSKFETASSCLYLMKQCLCVCFRIQRNSKHLNHSETLNWSLEGGYSDSEAKDTFPRRAMASGAHSGLTMIILQDKIIDPLCSYAIHGVQVSASTARSALVL
jgi:hypothetical protein